MAEYCLRWNNHQPNLVSVFSELLNAESLVDVTLATDGHFIHAHKLVLSACSAYFKDLFGSNPCKHPIVFLKDIRIEDLKTVIDFIYRGEVNVSQERLQDVLKTAESLRIKGLADKPFTYDEYPSQTRGQHLSSSLSSQRSSLTDSREQAQSVDNEDGTESSGGNNSQPASKKRKVASSQDSTESQQDANHEGEENSQNEGKDDAPPLKQAGTPSGAAEESSAARTCLKSKVKVEKDAGGGGSTEPQSEFQESRAADAMLMLQGSSSEGGEEVAASSSLSLTSGSRDASAGLVSSHSQGNLDWSLSLGHWWASVLPALVHQQAPSTPSLYLPRSPRSQVSPAGPGTLSSSSSASSGGGSSGRPPDVNSSTSNNNCSSSNNNNSNNNNNNNYYYNNSGSLTIGHAWGGNGGSSGPSREGSPAGVGGVASGRTQLLVGSLDQLSLVSALGKEISPQMVQALQAVAARRESFSSAAKLYSVSVTTLWRYYRKLGLSDASHK